MITFQYKNLRRQAEISGSVEEASLKAIEALSRFQICVSRYIRLDSYATGITQATDLESYEVYSGRNTHLFTRGNLKK
jgi:hypothetical protein